MLGFTVGVIAVITVLAIVGYAVAEVYRFLRRTVSRKEARPEVVTGEPVSGLAEVILSGVPRVSPEPPPEGAKLHSQAGRERASATSGKIGRYLRRFDLKSVLHVILGGLLGMGILLGLIFLCVSWDLFRSILVTFSLRFPWVLAGFVLGVVLEGRETRRTDLDGSEPPTSRPRGRFSASVMGVVIVFAVASAAALWMERYRFEQVDLENGESYPVRVNRVTGSGEVLYRGVWRNAAELSTLPALIQDLGAEDLDKLRGEADPHGDLYSELGFFHVSVYNGSDFTLKEITLEITVKDSDGEASLPRVYRVAPHLKQQHPPKQQADYLQDLGFSISPERSCVWKISAARGIKNSR